MKCPPACRRCWPRRSSFRRLGAIEARLGVRLFERARDGYAPTPAGEIEKNLRAALAGAFARLDLVTREEFDVQREVLARTRAKLEALEARAAELEARSRKSPPDPAPGS